MAPYLVEHYLPNAHLDLLNAAVEWTAGLAEAETCLCRFDAPDRMAVIELDRQADFPFDRIVEALDLLPVPQPREGA